MKRSVSAVLALLALPLSAPVSVGVVRAIADAGRAQFPLRIGLDRLPTGPGHLDLVWSDADGRRVGESSSAIELLSG